MERLVKKAQKGNWQAFLQLTLDQKGARVSGGGVFKFHEDLQKGA